MENGIIKLDQIYIRNVNVILRQTLRSKFAEYEKKGRIDLESELVKEILITTESQDITGLKRHSFYYETANDGVTYNCWVLMSLPQYPENYPIGPRIINNYGFAPVWRSSLIPGWGQFYKKQSKKGYFFLISETILISGALFSNYLSIHYHDKAFDAYNDNDYSLQRDYKNWSDTAESIAVISGIAAGVVYIYNIFDSVSSKGAKRYTSVDNNFKIYTSLNKNIIFFVLLKL